MLTRAAHSMAPVKDRYDLAISSIDPVFCYERVVTTRELSPG